MVNNLSGELWLRCIDKSDVQGVNAGYTAAELRDYLSLRAAFIEKPDR
jgi:hypothetical protein